MITSLRWFVLGLLLILVSTGTFAKNPYRKAFLDVYPNADGTSLTGVPSNTSHCGICHFDFNGGGQRNLYGVQVEIALNSGLYGSTAEAIAALDGDDSDNDGFTNNVEITETVLYANTPTFPGLKTSIIGSVLNVDPADLADILTPSGSTDTTPPIVTVTSPNGGESLTPNSTTTVTWTATDENGIAGVDVYLSDDAGSSFKQMARNLPPTGSFTWFVPNLPGVANRLRVVARDNANNDGFDLSDADFTIQPHIGGTAPTTLRDFELAGTQPFGSGILEDPDETCRTCHGDYNQVSEPWFQWRGSMMSQAMRDPIFLATMVIAEQDAPASGDLCLRCHTPGGWQEGRSADTAGGQLTAKDRQGVQCDFCHRQVDPLYAAGASPEIDQQILGALDEVPQFPANGQFVTDPDPVKRGPYADAQADHLFLDSAFHRESDLCGTCHDVSNPVFVQGAEPATYEVQALDTPHPDGDRRNMFPVERTFSEWSVSEYALSGVYAPQFAGDKPDGVVSSCQDCHMKDVSGKGAAAGPSRTDIGSHDLTGGNYFAAEIIAAWFPGEVDQAELDAGKARAIAMLQMAATLEITSAPIDFEPAVTVRVINETGHKLPSGYPEGRRVWINVRAYDGTANLVYESGGYNAATGELAHDDDLKVYHIEPGTSTRLGSALGIDDGPSFHFVLNDTVYLDNRIPPRGFTNTAFTDIQSPPVDYPYADGQYWDDTVYRIPAEAVTVEALLYYQTTSKEYIEFLRDENTTNSMGQDLYDAWVANGRAAPVLMASAATSLDLSAVEENTPRRTGLGQNYPNPFNPSTRIGFATARSGPVSLVVFDGRGRKVRTLLDETMTAGEHVVQWDGRDDARRRLPSGVYHYLLKVDGRDYRRKMTLLK
jgi:Bacterial Ig domain/FlgD Ig-like domain/Cytochrome c554 and c-prime